MMLAAVLAILVDKGLLTPREFMEVSDLLTLHECLEGKLKGVLTEDEYAALVEGADRASKGQALSMLPRYQTLMRKLTGVAKHLKIQSN
jgi:hypothetical protein